MRLVSIAVLATSAILGAAATSDACTCMTSPGACQAAWDVPAVFVADVVGVQDAQGDSSFARRRVQLRVAESFRGDAEGTVDLFTGQGGGDCGFPFVTGQRYLVYASRTGSGYQTGICSRTRRIDEAEEDLKYL